MQQSLLKIDFAAVDVEDLSPDAQLDVLKLAERVALHGIKRKPILRSPETCRVYFGAMLRNYDKEVFLVVFLNAQHEVLACEVLFQGTVDFCSVQPREIVRRALHFNAIALIIGHCHPSGMTEPSQADRKLTDRIRLALDVVDITLLDHLVVGCGFGQKPVSFAERGWL